MTVTLSMKDYFDQLSAAVKIDLGLDRTQFQIKGGRSVHRR